MTKPASADFVHDAGQASLEDAEPQSAWMPHIVWCQRLTDSFVAGVTLTEQRHSLPTWPRWTKNCALEHGRTFHRRALRKLAPRASLPGSSARAPPKARTFLITLFGLALVRRFEHVGVAQVQHHQHFARASRHCMFVNFVVLRVVVREPRVC